MESVGYIRERIRMTKGCKIGCDKCPLSHTNNGMHIQCREFEYEYPEKAEKIIEEWAKENPVKTRQSEFLKTFPNAEVSLGYIDICPRIVNKEFKCPNNTQCRDCEKACWDCRKEYWLGEIEEGE